MTVQHTLLLDMWHRRDISQIINFKTKPTILWNKKKTG